MVLRVAGAISTYLGFGDCDEAPAAPFAPFTAPTPAQPRLRVVPVKQAAPADGSEKWRRHPQLRAYTPPITPDVREARRHAVRGLYAARAGALDVATDHFAQAAACRDIDLTAIPGYWDLTRGQMRTAVDAYERVERYRDAAALDAQIATIFRPSLVGYTADPVMPRQRRRSGSGGS